MHYQLFFVYGLIFVAALFYFCLYSFSKITEAVKYHHRHRALKLSKKRRAKTKTSNLHNQPLPVVSLVRNEKPQKRYLGPICFEGRFYASVEKASAFLRRKKSEIESALGPVAVDHDDFALWKSIPTYASSCALLHRVKPVGRSSKRLVISDYRGGISKAYVKHGNQRTPIDLTVDTGADGDAILLKRASSI